MLLACTLIAIGDSHGPVQYFSQVVDTIIENEDPSSIIIHTGDIFSNNSQDQDALNQIERLRDYFSYSIIARGNHDDIQSFTESFEDLPTSKIVCDGVTLITLDSNRRFMNQLEFLKKEIDFNPSNRYIVVLHHNLQACSSGAPSDTFWNRSLGSLLRSQDLVIHGHNHTFCTYLLQNGTRVISASMANKKRYDCIEGNSVQCDDSAQLEYLRIKETEDSWEYERIRIH